MGFRGQTERLYQIIRRAGGDLRYQNRRMLVRAEWALLSVKPGGTAEVMYGFCPSSQC